MEEKIAVIGGDARSAFLAKLLVQDGHEVCTWGLEDAPNPVLLDGAVCAERVILPVPLAREEGFLNAAEPLSLRELFARFVARQKIFGGAIDEATAALAKTYGLTITDYFTDEALAVYNAVPTAEGAIALAMGALPVTIHNTPCLVIGFGRIGKLLAHRLDALGANVTVSARKRTDFAWADAFGYHAIDTRALGGKLGAFRVIFNTVPQSVLPDEMLGELRRDCLIVELASRPGFSQEVAKARGLCAVRAGGLPGKTAHETAARALRDTLYAMWEC